MSNLSDQDKREITKRSEWREGVLFNAAEDALKILRDSTKKEAIEHFERQSDEACRMMIRLQGGDPKKYEKNRYHPKGK